MQLNDETAVVTRAQNETGRRERIVPSTRPTSRVRFGAPGAQATGGGAKTIIFDIETGPLSDAELAVAMPPFDPSAVKTGNIKDPDKIAAKIAEAEANHQREFAEKAALDAMTGRVLAIGMIVIADCRTRNAESCKSVDTSPQSQWLPEPATSQVPLLEPPLRHTWSPIEAERVPEHGEFVLLDHADEAELLREFWVRAEHEMGRLNLMVGFNTHLFDLPFLVRRSWRHRLALPWNLRRGRYWSDQLIDLREAWQLGDRQAKGSLDAVARHLDVGMKNGEGRDFAKLWQTDRDKAIAYLRNDLQMTAGVAKALGVI